MIRIRKSFDKRIFRTETEPEGDLIDQLGEISLESQVGQVDLSQLLSGIAAAQSRSRAEHRIDLEKEEAFKVQDHHLYNIYKILAYIVLPL